MAAYQWQSWRGVAPSAISSGEKQCENGVKAKRQRKAAASMRRRHGARRVVINGESGIAYGVGVNEIKQWRNKAWRNGECNESWHESESINGSQGVCGVSYQRQEIMKAIENSVAAKMASAKASNNA